MPETTGVCACCNAVKPLRLMRYMRRASDKQFEYLCDVCRKAIKDGLMRR